MTRPAVGGNDNLIAITGATGFIGKHLLARLHAEGLHSRALIRSRKYRVVDVPRSTQIVAGALNDKEKLIELLKGAQTCIHLAGATTSLNMSGFHSANVIGTYNAAACAAAAGVKHFICVSSQAARAPLISNYAASKAMGEAALEPFKQNMQITIIRPPAVIGAGDPMLQPMLDLIRAGWLPVPAEPKRATRSFAVISVQDLVSQLVSSLERPTTGRGLVEPCSVASTNWTEVAAATGDVLGRKVRIVRIPASIMKGVALCADGIATLTRRTFPLSLSKVREMLAVDWTYDHTMRDAMSLKEVFVECLEDDRS
ncbi:MAG: NAD-dependent epimerase/dehydratase family protein [Henriciella sp.]|nr:NAD-dependent epimerase/dehydratase family protein [Henriciella sp.]